MLPASTTKILTCITVIENYNLDKEILWCIYTIGLTDEVKNAAKAQIEELKNSIKKDLKLDENKLRDMIQGVRDISLLPDPVNKEIWSKEIAENMTLKKISFPASRLRNGFCSCSDHGIL